MPSSTESLLVVLELLTKHEVAELLRCSVRHVERLQAARVIPYIKIGHLVRFRRAAVLRALCDQEVASLHQAIRKGRRG